MFSGTTCFEKPNVSILLKGKNLLRRVQMDKMEVKFVLWGVHRNSHRSILCCILEYITDCQQ